MAARDTKERLLELESRRRIYEHIRRVPGIHIRQLERDLQMPLGTIEYHLHQMERAGLLATRDEQRIKGYFPQEGLDRRDRDYLYYLRQAMPRRIAMEVADHPGISFGELKQILPISPSTLSFHLKKLVRAQILQERPQGRQKVYDVVEPQRVQRLIVQYRSSFADEIVDRFAEAWLDLGL